MQHSSRAAGKASNEELKSKYRFCGLAFVRGHSLLYLVAVLLWLVRAV